MLAGLESSLALSTLAYLDQLSEPRRALTRRAMVKLFHEAAATAIGEPLGAEERQAVNEKRRALLSLPMTRRAPATRGPRAERLARLVRQGAKLLGNATSEHRAGDMFELAVGDWRVGTRFVYGENPSYMQRVVSPSGECFADGVSYLASLGISGQTVWDAAVAGDEDAVASGMVELPRRFIAAMDSQFVATLAPD